MRTILDRSGRTLVNARLGVGRLTPLRTASERGHAECVAMLLDRGADVAKGSSIGERPHHLAAQNGHADILNVLLERGADPNQARHDGVTPLQMSVMGAASVSVVRVLLRSGARPDQHGRNSVPALHRAAALGLVSIVEALLDGGANPNLRCQCYDRNLNCDRGTTPIFASVLKGFPLVTDVLVRRGATFYSAMRSGVNSVYSRYRDVRLAMPDALSNIQGGGSASKLRALEILWRSPVVSEADVEMTRADDRAEKESVADANTDLLSPGAIRGQIVALREEIQQCRRVQTRVLTQLILSCNRKHVLYANHPAWSVIVRACLGIFGQSRGRHVVVRLPSLAIERERRWDEMDRAERRSFAALVGRRVRVSWNMERNHFWGTVTDFCPVSRKWTVSYDDGDTRRYDLSPLTRTLQHGRFALMPLQQDYSSSSPAG